MKITKGEVLKKMEQHLINLDEMINHKCYNYMIELADLRNEIQKLYMDLFDIHKFIEEKK